MVGLKENLLQHCPMTHPVLSPSKHPTAWRPGLGFPATDEVWHTTLVLWKQTDDALGSQWEVGAAPGGTLGLVPHMSWQPHTKLLTALHLITSLHQKIALWLQREQHCKANQALKPKRAEGKKGSLLGGFSQGLDPKESWLHLNHRRNVGSVLLCPAPAVHSGNTQL